MRAIFNYHVVPSSRKIDFVAGQSQTGPTIVINTDSFLNQCPVGSFFIREIELTHEPLECCDLRISERIRLVADHDKIQFDLMKLLNGERILRLTGPLPGLSLEKKLKPADAVVPQKDRLLQVFDAALARAQIVGV